jgi:predicted PurR-regulated permease PerM
MSNQFFTGKILTTISIVVFVVLLILLIVFAVNALLLIFGAILFAVFLRGLADLLAEKTGLGKGLSLATPLVAVVMVLVKMLYVEDVLGEEIKTPDDEWKNSNESGNLNAETQRR